MSLLYLEIIEVFFLESYSKKEFESIGINEEFVQDNHSKSKKGVLRGLHFQTKHSQGKLVRVIKGSVYDVAVDIRKESKNIWTMVWNRIKRRK